MTLEEAIAHLNKSLGNQSHDWGCEECKQEHVQLLDWLVELRKWRIADVAPVIHAEWLAFSDPVLKWQFTCYCSNCHEKSIRRYPYCPRCGAKMDGE